MLVVETIARIRRDHLVRGVPIKKIARDLRVSKNTVRKVVRGDETSYGYERKIQPMPKLGPWVDELERQLEANEKKPRRDRLSLCQWRSKKGPPRRCKKGPLGGCGLVPVVHGRAPRATRRALNRLTRRRAREGPVGPRGQAWAGWSVQLAVGV